MLHTKNKYTRALFFVGGGIGLVFSIATMYNKFIVHNISISEPTGYYLKLPAYQINVGNRYLICLDDKIHLTVMRKLGLPIVQNECTYESPYILKQVAAKPGDWVRVNESGVFINGKYQANSKPILTARGVQLQPLPFTYYHRLESDEYFMMGVTRTSYDSRYFGVIKYKQFHKRAILLMNDQ